MFSLMAYWRIRNHWHEVDAPWFITSFTVLSDVAMVVSCFGETWFPRHRTYPLPNMSWLGWLILAGMIVAAILTVRKVWQAKSHG